VFSLCNSATTEYEFKGFTAGLIGSPSFWMIQKNTKDGSKGKAPAHPQTQRSFSPSTQTKATYAKFMSKLIDIIDSSAVVGVVLLRGIPFVEVIVLQRQIGKPLKKFLFEAAFQPKRSCPWDGAQVQHGTTFPAT
jgi:hypothetical protein